MDEKDSNPKDLIAGSRLPLHLVPPALKMYASLGFLEGALKYGMYNWRVTGVRVSVYKAAIDRHLEKFWDGEWSDPKTEVPHLASVAASVGIILDAFICGKLIDDRPPKSMRTGGMMAAMEDNVQHLKELFKDCNPKQHTELDNALDKK